MPFGKIIFSFFFRPLVTGMYVYREGLLQFLDSFDDFRAAAITTAELGSFTSAQLALPQLHSPFTTEEGAKKWSAIMHQKTIEDLQASVEKGVLYSLEELKMFFL